MLARTMLLTWEAVESKPLPKKTAFSSPHLAMRQLPGIFRSPKSRLRDTGLTLAIVISVVDKNN